MPSKISNGAQYATVEIKPSNLAPSTPSPSSPSPKAVRFAPSSAQGVSRPLTNTEEWSIWHFENHAAKCPTCRDPYRVYKQGGRLCPEGHALARDVAIHVFYQAGEVYAAHKEDHKLVRVEVKLGYWHVIGLLRSMDHHLRSSKSRQPIISYDHNYPISARSSVERTTEHQPERHDRRETVVIEPESSKPDRRSSHRSSRHSSKRYDPVGVDDDVEAPPQPVTTKHKAHRGSLYDAEMARLEKDKRYRLEVREPEDSRRRRHRDDRRRERWE